MRQRSSLLTIALVYLPLYAHICAAKTGDPTVLEKRPDAPQRRDDVEAPQRGGEVEAPQRGDDIDSPGRGEDINFCTMFRQNKPDPEDPEKDNWVMVDQDLSRSQCTEVCGDAVAKKVAAGEVGSTTCFSFGELDWEPQTRKCSTLPWFKTVLSRA